MRRTRAGFTLIEIMASTLLTAGVVAGASAFFIQLSDASARATARTAEGRHAAAVLDRVARDLEGAYLLVAPQGTEDRSAHPWLFLAEERQAGDGADHLRFAVLNHVPRSTAGHSADLAVMSYALRDAEGGGYELWRWVQPGLPADLDRSWSLDESRGAVLAEGVGSFSVRFMSGEGDWTGTWDSSSEIEADQLPVAAEIKVALLDSEALELDGEEIPGLPYVRRVTLPVRPIDLAEEIANAGGNAGDGDGEEEADEDDEEGLSDDEGEGDQAADESSDCEFGTIAQCAASNGIDLAGLGLPLDPSACAQAQYSFQGQTVRCAP